MFNPERSFSKGNKESYTNEKKEGETYNELVLRKFDEANTHDELESFFEYARDNGLLLGEAGTILSEGLKKKKLSLYQEQLAGEGLTLEYVQYMYDRLRDDPSLTRDFSDVKMALLNDLKKRAQDLGGHLI
jgi:hypothetical protein